MRPTLLAPASLLLVLAAAAGCVERTLSIETVPADADVFLDGRHVGKSPVTVPFTFYGTREIVVRKPGYATERRLEPFEPPAFQRFPKDLYYETLTRDLYVDARRVDFVLRPLTEADVGEEVVRRAMEEAAPLRAGGP